ncbi:lysozyme [Asticcacaulis sp. AC402]|uniref:lysozyme n=1 Tax=Asticcacaulis sp. AC402 TaxID=1282361 RepID=UPI0003C3B942|nr:lysozyme [Asticcacaulis sp. AC402]ESQ74703.1 muraminidase [Asticcacaulis sp. AC402]
MKTSANGLDLIATFEGFRVNPYMPTPRDVPTVGYGTTVYPNGKAVKLSDGPVTKARAMEYLASDVARVEDTIHELVDVPLTQGQFDALVSFVYNVGEHAFEESTLLRRILAGNYAAAAEQFARWNKQKGVVLKGLVRRREAERTLFLS